MTDPGLRRSIVSGCALLETACRSRAACIGSDAPPISRAPDSAGCHEGLATVLRVLSSDREMSREAPDTIRRVLSVSFRQPRNHASHVPKLYTNVRERRS